MVEQTDLVTLHRYYIWQDSMRQHFEQTIRAVRDAGEDFSWGSRGGILAFQYLSCWYGGLYVVIEGWRTLGLQEERVDDLLDSPNVELLRRYRNGVFHFQRNISMTAFSISWARGRALWNGCES